MGTLETSPETIAGLGSQEPSREARQQRREELLRLLRFLALGLAAAAVNWLVRFPLSWIMPFGAAVALAQIIGMTAGFTLYRAYVFPATDLPLRRQILRFVGVNCVSGLQVWLMTMGLASLLPWLGFGWQHEAIAHGVSIGVGAVTSYIGHKFLTFRQA